MPTVPPRLPLVLLLLAAACILAGGVHFSRREQTVRIPQDRMPLTRFATDLMRELRRLEDLHQSHLDRLSRDVEMENSARTQKDCGAIVGVAECSFLVRGASNTEHYVRLPHVPYGRYPRPTFEMPFLNRLDFTVLDPTAFFENSGSSAGWVDEPGKPLLYWRQRSDKLLVLLTIEPNEVQATMTRWVRQWMQDHPAPNGGSHAGARVELHSPDGPPLLQDRTLPTGGDPPHWSQPLPTRYGTWNLVSWDHLETRVTHQMPTLIVAASLAMVVALLGGLLFVQQQRAHRVAAQRVSFVNRVSHELRTPLTNMLLNLDIVSESLPDAAPEPASRLALVREEAGRLARLIENVLTFSRREQGTLRLHPAECRPRSVVGAILTQFTPAFARRGISVTSAHEGEDALCLLDADALSQIAANLFSNVEKYAAGAPAEVLTTQHNGVFTLAVSDQGPGIPAAEQDRIFEPFARLDDRVSAGVTGTGLGLSIARELAQRMGGTLKMEPRSKGVSFVLKVPVRQALKPE